MLLTEDTTGEGFLDDGADLRIVYWNGTHNIELDRFNETAFDLTTTNIWFRIQSNISPGGYDDNYYMYYNNSFNNKFGYFENHIRENDQKLF